MALHPSTLAADTRSVNATVPPAVRPSSIAAWAGRALFDRTGQIDLVARRLGMRSLDRTAIFIGWDWLPDDR